MSNAWYIYLDTGAEGYVDVNICVTVGSQELHEVSDRLWCYGLPR